MEILYGINEVLHFRFKGEMGRMIKFKKAVYKLFKKNFSITRVRKS